jgi:hypothetical protein
MYAYKNLGTPPSKKKKPQVFMGLRKEKLSQVGLFKKKEKKIARNPEA